MTTQAELKPDQVNSLEMTISITLTVAQWNHIAGVLKDTQKEHWTGTKVDFINGICDSVQGMTQKMYFKYPIIPLPK